MIGTNEKSAAPEIYIDLYVCIDKNDITDRYRTRKLH